MIKTLADLMEDISAEIRTTSGGRIDFRTTIGRTTKSFIKKGSDEHAKETLDAATKVVAKAAAATPAKEIPDEPVTEEVVRRVVGGEVVKSTDLATQKRSANANSSLSSSERKRIALKAAKTRNKDKAGLRDADNDRAKSNAKRDLLNL